MKIVLRWMFWVSAWNRIGVTRWIIAIAIEVYHLQRATGFLLCNPEGYPSEDTDGQECHQHHCHSFCIHTITSILAVLH